MCDETLNAADGVSTNGSANVMSSVSTNLHRKARYKMGCYILRTVLLLIILLFLIAIICHHYVKHRSKLKNILPC